METIQYNAVSFPNQLTAEQETTALLLSEPARTWFSTGGTTPLSRQSREGGLMKGGGGGDTA